MGFIDTFLGSFHSAETYRGVRTRRNFMLGYSFLLVALTTFLVLVYYGAVLHRELLRPHNGNPPLFDDVVQQIANQLPVMVYKNGQLISNIPEPTIIKISGVAFGELFTDEPVITIDTSGKTDHMNMKTPILITRTEIIDKVGAEAKIQPISKYANIVGPPQIINQSVVQDWADRAVYLVHHNMPELYVTFGGVALFFLTIYFFLMRLFMLLALGLMGLLFATLLKVRLEFIQTVGLAAVSYTPVALLDMFIFIVAPEYMPRYFTLFLAGSVTLFAAITFSRPYAEPRITAG